MNTLKKHILRHFDQVSALLLFTFCCGLLLLLRVKITHSFFYLFLVWNLFLAAIPYALSFWLSNLHKPPKVLVVFSFVAWLLFLPNAPYILTDFIHLQLSSSGMLLFDLLLVSVFSITGLYFYCASVFEMRRLLALIFSETLQGVLFFLIPFLCGFGIYLGRVLRFNSWDLLHNPASLFIEIGDIAFHPLDNKVAWMMTLGFGVLLLFLSKIYSSNMRDKVFEV